MIRGAKNNLNQLFFFECSAKSNVNVVQAFKAIAQAAVKQSKSGASEDEFTFDTKVNLNPTKPKKDSGCC